MWRTDRELSTARLRSTRRQVLRAEAGRSSCLIDLGAAARQGEPPTLVLVRYRPGKT